ncbi:MAG: hypothetical protein ACFFD3_04365 [Candidatus Thorarchaeota archaeon]
MPRAWMAIAKAELLVTTSRFRRRRYHVSLLLVLFVIFWAFFLAPSIMIGILDLFSLQVQQLLQVAFPGVMRSLILILWTMVLVYPITYALQEVKIGQWEVMLSNNVSTRDMLLGMFLGRIPSYSLLVLFMAPLLVSPFLILYEVSIIGQMIIYVVIAVFVLATLLLSTVISTAIQAKLGTSARGNDIAKAMGLVVVLVFLLPLYGLIYFAETFAQILGLSVFLLLPSTWAADLVTWITIYFNGIDLPSQAITIFEEILEFGIESDIALVAIFAVVVMVLGFVTPDRIFSLESGARTETVTTTGRENAFLRAIRRVAPGSAGVLIVMLMKDFGRKAQNTSKVVYAIVLSIIVPLMISYSSLRNTQDALYLVVFTSFFISMFLGMLGGLTFGGIGFLESKDHLWIIKSSYRGVSKFLAGRVISALFFAIPIVLIPVVILSTILSFQIAEAGIMMIHAYLVLSSTILVAIGITCLNPAYEDTKSSAFHMNAIATLLISMFAILVGFIIEFSSGIFIESFLLGSLTAALPVLIIGPVVLFIGSIRLTRSEG